MADSNKVVVDKIEHGVNRFRREGDKSDGFTVWVDGVYYSSGGSTYRENKLRFEKIAGYDRLKALAEKVIKKDGADGVLIVLAEAALKWIRKFNESIDDTPIQVEIFLANADRIIDITRRAAKGAE